MATHSREAQGNSSAPRGDLRPGRIWPLVLGTALVASLAAWGVEELSIAHYGPGMVAESAPPDFLPELQRAGPYGPSMAGEAYNRESTARAVAASGGTLGALFGLTMGLTLGVAGGSTARAWFRGLAIGLLCAATGGALGWLAAWRLVPMFYAAKDHSSASPRVLETLLLVRGVPRMIAGMVGGLTLGIALGGGWTRLAHGAIGGLIGATLGALLVVVGDEMLSLVVAQVDLSTAPILRSPARRVAAILAVSLPTAACATWAILSLKLPSGRVPGPDAPPAG